MSDNVTRGHTRVSDEALLTFIRETALAISGVHDMGFEMSASSLTKNLLGQDRGSRGVRVTFDEESGYIIDIYLIAAYGANIPETAWNVQKGVYDGLKTAFDVEPEDINIHIQGVRAE